jgi:hypothetical protein
MASNRNSTDYDRNRNDNANIHVGDIIGKDVTDIQALRLLHEKYPNDTKLAEKAFDVYKERLTLVQKKANKFKNLIFSKYSTLALPSLLEKARKFKKKYELDDDEFDAFIKMAISDKSYSLINQYNQPNTPMSKLLGHSEDMHLGKMNVPTNELDILQDILRLYGESSVLHEQIKIQSLTYQDCAPQAITGVYDRRKHNSFSYIHPVIAALFLPRIKYIDEHMLLSNLAYIVHSRHNGIPIRTLPDYEVYWDLRTDPNEIVCVSPDESPLVDLRNRIRLQIELWKQVRELREGRYYSDDFRTFNTALDMCKNNLFNDAEMANVRDEGTVIRKLFGAFSLRPTVISISSMTTGIMTGNYNLGPMTAAQVTSIPIVNLRLPLTFRSNNTTVYLNSAFEQYNWIVENKSLTPKVSNIIYSRDVIVFYANRRYQSINFGRVNAPYNFTTLPATHSGLETINGVNISYDDHIIIGDDQFYLRSAVFVERSLTNRDLITGCSAGIIMRRDFTIGRTDTIYLSYDPQGAGIKFEDNGAYISNDPITQIQRINPYNNSSNVESFQQRAATRGTIFIYVKDAPQNTVIRPN